VKFKAKSVVLVTICVSSELIIWPRSKPDNTAICFYKRRAPSDYFLAIFMLYFLGFCPKVRRNIYQ
jgi:hypothetical protein